MDPNEQQQLKEALELARENNVLIKKMWRAVRWGRALKIFYWLFIIGVAIGAFYFLQPYIDTLQDVYGGVQDVQANFRGFF
jgi:polyferredoxin